VPTLITTANQGTIIQYLVRKTENGTYRDSGAQPTPQSAPPRLALESDGSDTPPSEVITPREQSPELVDWRGALDSCQVDWGATREADESSTGPTEDEQPSYTSAPDDTDRYRESRAQPTPLGETTSADGPDEQPSDVPILRDSAVRFDWQFDLKDNAYQYERLVEQVGPAEQTAERNTSFRTTATLNLQPITLLTRWLDDLPDSGGGSDRVSPATKEHTLCLGPTDSPV